MNVKRVVIFSCCVLTGFFSSVIFADAQVVEAGVPYNNEKQMIVADNNGNKSQTENGVAESQSSSAIATEKTPNAVPQDSATPSANLSSEQRLERIEKQMNNLVNLNLPQQITVLQQEIAQLRGQLEVQDHDLQLLNKQVRSFYKDLDNRINQMNNLNSGSSGSNEIRPALNKSVELQDADAYQSAFNLLISHDLNKSQQSFNDYLNQYPNGKYVSDAHYWLGEIYFSKKDLDKAASEFDLVVTKYATAAKVSDAKLRLAIIHANNGKIEQAKSELQSIKASHPQTTAAQLASLRLQQLEDGLPTIQP